MRIAIAVPYYKIMPTKSTVSLIELFRTLQGMGFETEHLHIDNTYLDDAREFILDKILAEDKRKALDYVFHIDSDQSFFPRDAKVLLSDANRTQFPILSGIYFGRTHSIVNPVYMYRLDEKTRREMAKVKGIGISEIQGKYYRPAALPNQEFFEADVAGMGFMLVRPKVYYDIIEKSGRPVFEVRKEGNHRLRDDVVFCEKAREAGYKIMLDNNVKIGHEYGTVTYRDFRAWRTERYLIEKNKEIRRI